MEQGAGYEGASATREITPDERNWAMLAHLSALIALVFSAGTIAWLCPLVIWLIKSDESVFVSRQAKESLNFQITLFLVNVIAWICFLTIIGICVAAVLWIFVGVAGIVFGIIAAIRVNAGEAYRYPLNIRLIP